jgi:regulator of RNase E activity RraA
MPSLTSEKREHVTPELNKALAQTSTASIAGALLQLGLRNIWIRGAMPIAGGGACRVGEAFTMRFLPMREDLAGPALARFQNSREAIEAMEVGSFAVIDAMGVADAGVAGDVLCARMAQRGVVGLVTDGAVRDVAGVQDSGLAVWSRGTASPAPNNCLTFVDWGLPVACGGVAVLPGDLIVGDRDGAVVIPKALGERVAAEAAETERFDAWVLAKVAAGERLPGLYPPNQETRERYRREVADGV